jgi:hypothetical protein
MKGKMRIIILAAIAILSFAASYIISPWLGGQSNAPLSAGVNAPQTQPEAKTGSQSQGLGSVGNESIQPASFSIQSPELKTLITELRLKLDDCKNKELELTEREKRTTIAVADLKKQAQELEKLRLELIPALQRYQETRKGLEAAQIVITAQEDKNIKLLAARYDAMDSEGAAKILTDLWLGSQEELAVKILYYMQARSAAKVLSAISSSDNKGAAELAARLSEKFPSVRKTTQKKG